MPEDIQRIVDLVLQLWNTGNPEIATQLYSDAAERNDPNGSEPARGAQQIGHYVAGIRTAFPDFRLEITERLVEGDRIASHWRATGTQNGEFLGIPPTGRRVDISGVTLAQVKDGKVIRERVYFDRLAMLEQLGAAPGAAQKAASASS
jgi:steroid delta-isomerase-like uncharacterized protein